MEVDAKYNAIMSGRVDKLKQENKKKQEILANKRR